MPDFGRMVDNVLGQLQGWSQITPQFFTLKEDLMLDDQDTLFVEDPGRAYGVFEVGDELVYISGQDSGSLRYTIPSWGRGFQGTTRDDHFAGSRVTFNPLFPRSVVKRVLNEEISASFPQLFAVGVDESQTAVAGQRVYPLPFDSMDLYDVQWFDSAREEWVRVSRWREDNSADDDLYPSDRTVTFTGWGAPPPGARMKLVYRKRPTLLSNDSDDFVITTGLPDGAHDVMVLGAVARLVVGTEMSRMQMQSVEQSDRSTQVSSGAPLRASQYMVALQQQRLGQVRDGLLARYPVRVKRSR